MKPSNDYHQATSYPDEPGGLRRLDYFISAIEAWRGDRPRPEIRVLDVGCGAGNISRPLARLGYAVTGLEPHQPTLAIARQSIDGNRCQFFGESVETFQPQQPFDVIILSEVLEHLDTPVATLKKLHSWLVPGGWLLVSVPNGKSLEESLRRLLATRRGRRVKLALRRLHIVPEGLVQSHADSPHLHFNSLQAWHRLFALGGFTVVDQRPTAAIFKEWFYLMGRLVVKRGSRLFHAFDAADNTLADRLPLRMGDGWMMSLKAK